MKVYVAASSKEIERAARWVTRLQDAGIIVTSTWIENIRKVGQANPPNATRGQYQSWFATNHSELQAANVFWLLQPEQDTIGAWVELGLAYAHDKLIVGSGRHRPIHTNAMVKYHSEYDAEIFDFLRRLDKAHDGLPTDEIFQARARGAHGGA